MFRFTRQECLLSDVFIFLLQASSSKVQQDSSSGFLEQDSSEEVVVKASTSDIQDAYQGTVEPYPQFDAEADCKILYSAMKGSGMGYLESVH